MLISYPILTAAAVHDDEDVYLANFIENHLIAHEGRYPVSTLTTPRGPLHRWHGGVHLHGGGQPIRAIADGTVVAYRFAATRETYAGQGDYDTSFVLLRHETQTGENTAVVFHSLYMHLANRTDLAPDRFQQLPEWLRRATPGPGVQRPPQELRVWRKDVLGFAGQLYGVEAMHFEVFMLDADFNRVWRDSTRVTQGVGSNDWYGDAHFVIPENQQFSARHPDAGATGPHRISFVGAGHYELPLGQAGRNAERLYVSVKLQQGRRIATTYRAAANGLYEPVGAPVVQDDYEYELYRLACAIYTDCPSAGFEWLRFGRVLGTDTTTKNQNWQLVRYSDTAIGYIDLAAPNIVRLSDADFPHWLGWEKRDEGQTTHAADGLCDDQRTLDLVQAAQGNEAAARKLQHLVCKAPTEWDDSDLATRYARLREPGQPLQSEASWTAFREHVGKLAFWSQAGMAERAVWHFHPLRFVRHFRKCGWLSSNELSQCFPRHLRHLRGTQFHVETTPWEVANSRATRWARAFNIACRKYGIATRQRLIHLLGNVVPETRQLAFVKEIQGETASYSPYYGRGLIQLTHLINYAAYGDFRAFASRHPATTFPPLGWDPDDLIARDNSGRHNYDNCADSACFFLVRRFKMLSHLDAGTSTEDAITVCKDINGYVAIENLNGLDARLQSVVFLRFVLGDLVPRGDREPLIFSWRRNSQKELVYDARGNVVMVGNPPYPKRKFFVTQHSISVLLDRQVP